MNEQLTEVKKKNNNNNLDMFRTEVGNININTRSSWIFSVEFAGLKIQIDIIFLLCKLVRKCVYVSELYCRSHLLC